MMHALVASSARYERFSKDEVLSTVILVEGNLSGYIAAKDVERFGRKLDDLLQLQPTHVELVLKNYFMQLIAAMYTKAKVDELSPDLRKKLTQMFKDVRKKGIHPLHLILQRIFQESGSALVLWNDILSNDILSSHNKLCLSTLQQLFELVMPKETFTSSPPSSPKSPARTGLGGGVGGTSRRSLTPSNSFRFSSSFRSKGKFNFEDVGEGRLGLADLSSPDKQAAKGGEAARVEAATGVVTPPRSPSHLKKESMVNSLQKFQQRAQELSQQLIAADENILESRELWKHIEGLEREVREMRGGGSVAGLGKAEGTEVDFKSSRSMQMKEREESDRALQEIDEVASQVTYSTVASQSHHHSSPLRRAPSMRLGSSLPLPPPPTPLEQLLLHPPVAATTPSFPAKPAGKDAGQSVGSSGFTAAVGSGVAVRGSMRGIGGVLSQHYTSSKFYLREVLDVSLSKKPVQIEIFRSPMTRQQSGKKNVYDTERFRWVAAGGLMASPISIRIFCHACADECTAHVNADRELLCDACDSAFVEELDQGIEEFLEEEGDIEEEVGEEYDENYEESNPGMQSDPHEEMYLSSDSSVSPSASAGSND
eukprot:gene29389-35477_t